ncbi:MAG: hypothetical protein HQ592_13560 [Planctomycetes bacterium]|nr:hypothetical protein [Planctomycetota bacterium]
MNCKSASLIWVPVIHTQSDLGSLAERSRDTVGRLQWQQRREVTEELWHRIRREIDDLRLDYERVRLYQDGLPHCGYEEQIITDLANAGNQNHVLLLDLMAKGARLTGTESPDLLTKQYEVIRGMLSSHSLEDVADLYTERSRALLLERDRYIAQRISDTLATGETGLIFLGMLHSVEDYLSPDIGISMLGGTVPILEQAGIASHGKAAEPDELGEALPQPEAL